MSNLKVQIIALIAVTTAAVVIIAWMMLTLESVDPTRATIVLPDDTIIHAEVARNTPEHIKGLSGRDMIGDKEAMLFVYDKEEIQTFWMKGMLFDLDIIWLNNGEIIGIEEAVPAPLGDDIEHRSSQVPIDMVLEVKSGFSAEHGLQTGDILDIFWGK